MLPGNRLRDGQLRHGRPPQAVLAGGGGRPGPGILEPLGNLFFENGDLIVLNRCLGRRFSLEG
jgi:hypothetical protein